MYFPIRIYFLDRCREGIVGGPDEHGCFVLRAIWMQIVTVTEPVGVVKTNHGPPPSLMQDFQLDSVFQDSLAATLVRAAHPCLSGLEFLKPLALDQVCFGHAAALHPFSLTGAGSFFQPNCRTIPFGAGWTAPSATAASFATAPAAKTLPTATAWRRRRKHGGKIRFTRITWRLGSRRKGRNLWTGKQRRSEGCG